MGDPFNDHHPMEKAKPSTDRIFKAILLLCVVVMILDSIAWARGWEHGGMLTFLAGCLMILPLFHFAMHWPDKDA